MESSDKVDLTVGTRLIRKCQFTLFLEGTQVVDTNLARNTAAGGLISGLEAVAPVSFLTYPVIEVLAHYLLFKPAWLYRAKQQSVI